MGIHGNLQGNLKWKIIRRPTKGLGCKGGGHTLYRKYLIQRSNQERRKNS
jgi:hypothetical protein